MSASKKTELSSFLNSPLNKLSKPYRVQSAVVLSTKGIIIISNSIKILRSIKCLLYQKNWKLVGV